MRSKKKLIYLIILLALIIPNISAIIANSTIYSIEMFGYGIQSSELKNSNLEAKFLSQEGSGSRVAKTDSFSANIGFFKNTSYYSSVSINSYSIYPKSNTGVSIIRLYISANNHESIWAEITRPDSVVNTITLSNKDYTYYTAGLKGRYNIVFYANSSSGSLISVIDYFEILEVPSSVQNSGSSGEGTTKVIEKCTINWDCTPWSICVDGKQKRSCENIGNCIGENNKPNEEIACSEVLFDISLKLNNINLTQSKNLLFDLNLSENLSGEEIDVHIKYSILDEENNEIFSQIETKAIKEKLNIHKTIDEVILEDGIYTLRTDILYGNLQRAFAEQKFRVFEGEMDLKIPPLTGRVTGDTEFDGRNILITFIISATTILLILTFYNYRKKIFPFFKSKKHKKNSLIGLLNKRVYCGEGNLIGKVEEINIGKNKIDSIVVILDRKKKKTIKYKGKRIGIKYSDVKVVGNHILIVDKRIMEKL